MLKLSVGYQFRDDISFLDIVNNNKDHIEEVYFPWPDMATGRSKLVGYEGYSDEEIKEVLLYELKQIRSMGIRLELLFNANCYGEDAMSVNLQKKVYSVLENLDGHGLLPDGVTTTSPAIAYMLKNYAKQIPVRASVNMKIGSVKGMQYMEDLFDGFCVAKECNRDLEALGKMSEYAKQTGKKLILLANSGCMRNCSGQIFHDNCVAHESEISQKENIAFVPYSCWRYLKDARNFVSVLQNTWVLPEDIDKYEGYVDTIKLATRSHHLPGMVIRAYAKRRYFGNLLDLFEPGFGPAFAPYVLDSAKLPKDFWQCTTSCNKNCESCDYCKNVLKDILINSEM